MQAIASSQAVTTTGTSFKQRARDMAVGVFIAFTLLVVMAYLSPADAGSDTTFDNLVTMVVDWLEGSLGKFLAIGGFAIALGAGLIRGSVTGIVFGLGVALAAVYGPGIITGMFSALI